MACLFPIRAYRLHDQVTENGKSVVVFNEQEISSEHYEPIKLPCGKCIECRLSKVRDWTVRICHETEMWSENCFVTLTYDDQHVDPKGSLVKTDFPKFIRRLRKKYKGKDGVRENGKMRYPVRYFYCGEYGEEYGRPHLHACIFNFDFTDKVYQYTRDGIEHFTSEKLSELWQKGRCEVGEVTEKSAAYCASYIMKKKGGDSSGCYVRFR